MQPVSPASRRIVTYWLLLLVPTLLVGAGAIQLLRREQARLAEQSAEARETRRAAVAARARLIAENVELLVGDVQAGLLDVLAAAPAESLDAFLGDWERSQPLVRTAFRSTLGGRLLRPTSGAADEDARGFVRRFGRRLSESPPWSSPMSPDATNAPAQAKTAIEDEARKAVSQNVAQVQSARRDVQELFKTPYPTAANAGVAPSASSPAMSDETERSSSRMQRRAEADLAAAAIPEKVKAEATASDWRRGAANEGKVNAPAAQVARMKDAAPDRRGWLPHLVDGRLHLLGWVLPSGATEVRGVELELAAMTGRLAGALPTEAARGEGYALRDHQRRTLHQIGQVPAQGAPAVTVPLAENIFPGWEVVGFLNVSPTVEQNGRAFFWISILLVAIFVTAILAGGSLLLWQARRSEEEAAQKTSFVANVSHEFKTPLTTIRLYSELLEQGRVRDAAQGSDYLRTIGRETQRLARLVNNALDFSRLEQGRKKFAREPVDLTAELSRLLDSQAPRLAECGLTLRRQIPDAAVTVMTDRDALEQIVLNLLDNACKYASEGREVTVALTTGAADSAGSGQAHSAGSGQAPAAEVRVADRGPGVPSEHRDRIFEKFHRVDDALTAEKTGAGLGLSIARQLARGLGGELRFAPREGGGAEFILQLP
ncbi:MAG: HAMP domain-containing sensor histidine kinase [Opitutaceae bacterium]|nr:HAMP domain-containing sensor histidine kinase [Opitutaceae bacterium]